MQKGRTKQDLTNYFDMKTRYAKEYAVELLEKIERKKPYAWVSDSRVPFERKGGRLRFRLDAVVLGMTGRRRINNSTLKLFSDLRI